MAQFIYTMNHWLTLKATKSYNEPIKAILIMRL